MSINAVKITDELYQYLVTHSVRETSVQEQLRQATLQLPGGSMMASPEQSQFIALLIKLMNAKLVLEIGTFTGYTTLAMATALSAEGRVITCDISSEAPQVAQQYWAKAEVANKIEQVICSGLTLLDELILQGKSASVDLAFVDADKQNNMQYFEKLLTLVRPGGLIVVDNVLWKGRVLEKDSKGSDKATVAIQSFNDHLSRDDRVDVSIIPLGDGLTLARKII